MDATRRALTMLMEMPRRPILLSGVTYGGFNIIDPRLLQRQLRVPVIVVTGSKPSNRAVRRALTRHFPDWRQRWKILGNLGPIETLRTAKGEPPVYYESFGLDRQEARRLIRGFSMVSRIPEPLRVASMVARQLFPIQIKETSRSGS